MKTIYHYFGVIIFRSTEPGYRLRYTASLGDGSPLAADTLAGIKQLIKERLNK